MKILIIGGDSRLAIYLKKLFREQSINFFSTTRRACKLKNDQLFLDFEKISDFAIPADITSAIIIGGITDYKLCENNYSYAHFINCVQIPSLVRELLNAGIHVCFISTNTVFTQLNSLPTEYETHNPSFSYASLKSKSEHMILTQAFRLNACSSLSILRLTKNIGTSTSPFDTWMKEWTAGRPIKAFDDLYFAPVLFSHSANAISNLLNKRLSGIFHLSGEKDVSYGQFAKLLIRAANINPNLLERTTSKKMGVTLLYSHNITGLNMKLTTCLLGIKPVPISEIIDFLVKHIRSLK